ncbi:MAG: 50S ribosomal protein L21 [Patescibacteria group bacterium]
MKKFSVIETGGKQYVVSDGDKLRIDRLKAESGGAFTFDKVLLMVDGDKVEIGTPYIDGAKVEAKVAGHGRDEKKLIFRYHSKTRYRKKKGHRQPNTQVEINKV